MMDEMSNFNFWISLLLSEKIERKPEL